MVENEPFLIYGIEHNTQPPIQIDFIDEVILVDKKHTDLFYFIEFIYIDGLADVWMFTDNYERKLAFEYIELSIARYAVIDRMHARLN